MHSREKRVLQSLRAERRMLRGSEPFAGYETPDWIRGSTWVFSEALLIRIVTRITIAYGMRGKIYFLMVFSRLSSRSICSSMRMTESDFVGGCGGNSDRIAQSNRRAGNCRIHGDRLGTDSHS